MAVAGSGRGPIKVGSGYIDVFPKLNQSKLRETRAQIEKQMGATGEKAGKLFANGLVTQMASIPKKAKAAADKAQKEIQKSAMDSKKVLGRIEAELTKTYGKEAGKRFRAAQDLEKQKRKLLEATSSETRKALQLTVKEEQAAARNAAKAWETAERERLRMIAERTRAAERAARDEAAAQRRSQIQQREEIRRTLTAARSARLADLRSQMDTHRDQLASLRGQLQTYRRQMQDHTSAVGRSLTGLQTGWRRQGEAIERLGTNISETGRIINTSLLMPLGAVASLISSIGVKSADMRILGQMGLTAAGVDKKKSANEMTKIQQYAIDTPFSIDVMHEYQMKLIRSIAGNDKTWYDPKTKTNAANRAAGKTSDIIMAIGDTMARAGNLDPAMFQRAMYAVDRIMDMGKAPTRNINQLVQATGIPAAELAKMFGYNTSGQFWKVVGTPVAKGGGISGVEMIDNILQQWDKGYFKLDKNGKRIKDSKTGQAKLNYDEHSSGTGSKGYGEMMTSATISGRIQQMKERTQFELGSLFAQEDKKSGEYRYTGLGEALMGKRKVVTQKYIDGGVDPATGAPIRKKNPNYGEVTYEGGLLQQVKTLMGGQKGNAVALMQTLFESLGTFVKQIQKVSDWLEAHPEVKEAFTKIIKLAAAVAPFILAIGLATKVFGKVTKMFSSALTPLKGLFKGVRGAVRTTRQTGSALRAGLRRGQDASDARVSMTNAYRQTRTRLRGGDVRGPIARTRDRITGRDSGVNQIRTQMRDTENAINDTEEAIRRLQREIRDVNSVSIRQLVDQFEGHDNNSLTQASRNTVTQVNNVRTQVGELNRSSLSTLDREVNSLGEKFKDLEPKVKSAIETVGDLNKKNLNGFKLSVDSATGTVDDLQDKVKNTTLDVGDLNKKSLSGLIDEFHKSTDACDKLHDKVKATISQVTNLNKAKLGDLRKEFSTLRTKVNDVHTLVGTSKSGLHGRITNLDNKSLSKIKKSVDNLKDALKEAGDKAGTLENRLDGISNHAPGGSSGGSSKKKGKGKKDPKATGGVLSGYTPGRDVHVFTSPTEGELHLSGGEAVMRPEFTAAVGESNINKLNLLARTKGIHGVRKAMKFADGGTIRRLGLDQLVEGARNFNVGENTLGAFDTMRMDSSSRNVGGTVQPGIVGAGTDGSHFIGSDMARKFEGIKNYISRDSWDILKKLPIPDGVSQAVGVIGGIVGPIAGDYLWDNVWKGKGNVLERGSDFLDDLFSTKTLSSIWDNAISGVTDSAKAFWKGGVSAVTDPVGTVTDAVDGVWDLMAAEYQGVVDMIASVKEIYTSPMDYADQVFRDIYSTAKESMPNLEGLFDFSDSNFRSGRKPDMAKLVDKFSKPGKGSAVTRWTPQVKMALAQLGLPASALDLVLHRINVESGGNPAAINNWDSNAKAGHPSQGLMQTIPSTFAAYAGPYKSRGILDPFANIYAGLNYARNRYGSGWQKALQGNKGYASGTDGADSGWAWVGEEGPELVNFKGGETVLNHQDSMVTAKKVNRGYASGTTNSGLYKAMIGSTSQLNTALTKLRDLLSKAFSADLITKSQHGSLSKWLEKENSKLSKQATKRADIATKIKNANSKLTELKNDAAQMATSISSEASGGSPLAAALNGGNGVTPEAALSGLQDRLAAIKEWKSALTSLGKKGYSPEILKEVASEGLTKGTEMAKALLTADSSQVKDITKTYGQIFSQSDALGKGVADQYYSAGSKATKALLAGLKSEEKELLKGITSMVSKMITELRKKLGVSKGEPVPSSVASLFTWLTGLSQPTKSTKKSTKKKLKGYAIGTLSASPGLSLVGERGPELVNFRGGERVHTTKDTESLLSSGRPIYITVQEAKHEVTPQAVLKGLQYYDTMYGNRL